MVKENFIESRRSKTPYKQYKTKLNDFLYRGSDKRREEKKVEKRNEYIIVRV